MRIGRIAFVVALMAAAFIGGYGYGRWYGPGVSRTESPKAGVYYCPMHPGYKSDEPGNCPICGMKLIPLAPSESAASAPAAEDRKVLYYRDPQDHSYTAENPGLNPETGNELEPVYEDDPSAMPMGTIRVSPEKQQLIGVKYGVVEMTTGRRSFRAVGKVAYDETRIAKVQTRIEGWIDKVFVDFTGKQVEKGQPLLTVYSPEMLASQQEYLLALRSKDILKASPLSSAAASSESLIASARRRLELFGLSEAQIDEVEKSGKPLTHITIYSPIRGHVVERNAFPQQRIMPDTVLYTVVDLDRVWIMADVFESDASLVRVGQPAVITLSYIPGARLRARVSYIQPQVDPMTRTLQARLEAENRGLELKPDMFVDVEFEAAMAPWLTVAADAVLDSGLRKTVFVDRGHGFLEPRLVETGDYVGDRVEIRKGLKAGERIVVSGTFLIDSESQLRSAASGMAGHQHGGAAPAAESPPARAPEEHKHD
ncbi:MAG: efflux RND transporter periplasmic adaptor subunit [Bryobacteraceae bacterium]|nr:efflux RND transporter periplasmic adaptor subunit [Bryobacteraceae bacterium]